MKIKLNTYTECVAGLEKITRKSYPYRGKELVVDTVMIRDTKTNQIKTLYDETGKFIVAIISAFDKAGKKAAKYICDKELL